MVNGQLPIVNGARSHQPLTIGYSLLTIKMEALAEADAAISHIATSQGYWTPEDLE